MLILHFAPNTIAVATAVALEEAGLAYEPRLVDFGRAEQTRPAYLAINPKGRVPALVTARGVLTETGALLDYVASLAPGAGLLPADAFEAAQVRSVVHYLAATMHVNHAHGMRGYRWAETQEAMEDMAAKVPETMTASAGFMEDRIAGPLLFGDRPTIADCHFFAVARWLEGDAVDLAAFPKIAAFLDTMQARPSVAACREKGILT